MTITLDLAPAAETLLSDMAEQDGQNKQDIASYLLATALEQAARERGMQAVLEGLEDSHAGRVTPLTEWKSKFRARHNIPAGAKPMSHEEAASLP